MSSYVNWSVLLACPELTTWLALEWVACAAELRRAECSTEAGEDALFAGEDALVVGLEEDAHGVDHGVGGL